MPPFSLLNVNITFRGGTETNREHFADICNSLLSQIDNESYLYRKVWLSMLFEYVCLYYVYGIKVSNRQYVQDSSPISLCRLLQISVKRSRLVSVPPLTDPLQAKFSQTLHLQFKIYFLTNKFNSLFNCCIWLLQAKR